jgi:hypothetical protein
VIEEYLGDGVYATWTGDNIWLDTRGQGMPSTAPCGTPGICLESFVYRALVEFVDRVTQHGDSTTEDDENV